MKRDPTATHYVDNKAFFAAIVEWRKEADAARASLLAANPDATDEEIRNNTPVISNYIGECLYKIANGLSYKTNFVSYTYRDEMVLDAIENCIVYFDRFKPEKSQNPFAYFTQISYYAFLRRIMKEKKAVEARNRYILAQDFTDLFNQEGDDSTYANGLVTYLKKQVDLAQRETGVKAKDPLARRPKYMAKAKQDVNSEVLFGDEDELTLDPAVVAE